MKLIDNWRDAPKMMSAWVAIAAVAWTGLPESAQAGILAALHVPPGYVPAVFGAAFLLARVLKQEAVSGSAP